MIFKVLSSIVYFIMDNYVCVNYLCFPKTKPYVTNKFQVFENRPYNAVSRIVVPELLMNVILRHGFLNNTNSGVTLSCCRKLVDYYVQNNFFLNDNISNAFNNVPLRVIKIISAEHLYKKYFVIT